MNRIAWVFCALPVGIASPALADLVADQTPFHTYRGLWVSRFEYSTTASSINTVFANAQAMGITDVMFQVRGRADAYYNPKIVNGNYFEHRVSSFDSLAQAISSGRSRGIRVHAWINAMPLWSGTTLPTDLPGNPYVINTHPEYWIRDSSNTPQPLNSSYVIVNPTMPEVKQHIYEVAADIASKYDVDGLHLDYIRFYHDTSGSTPITYPTDPASVARFQAVPGNAGKTPTSHKADYQAWMAANVTELVAGIRQTLKSNRPSAQLTAAIWRDANIGYNSYQQDWKNWVDMGLLDAGMPMIYRKGFAGGGTNMDPDSGDLYRLNVTSAVNWRGNAGIMPGVGIYMQDDAVTAYNNVTAQLNYARDQGANGVQLFSYGSLMGTGSVSLEIRRAWLDFLAANNSAPAPATITDFEVDEGHFIKNITYSGSNQNVASGSADRVTNQARSGVGSQKIVINKTAGAASFLARHVSGNPNPANPDSNITFPSIGAIGFWLKTTTADMEVAIAVDDYSDNTSTERSYFQNVIADGQWHQYQWLLNDVSHWGAWAGANTDGTVEATFTLDSVQFRGTAGTTEVYFDDVYFSAAAAAPNQWTLDSATYTNSPDTNWTNSANWSGGVPNAIGATANLLRRATAAQVVTVNSPITLGSLNFDNLSSYNVAGTATITMDVSSGSAAISVVNRGSHTIAAPIRLNDSTNVSVDWAATLTVSGQVTSTTAASLTKSGAGTLAMHSLRAGALNVNAGAMKFTAKPQANDPTATSVVTSLSVATGASLDLGNNSLIIDYTGGTPVNVVRLMLYDARLSSSSASSSTGIGYGDNTVLGLGSFGGQAVDPTSVLIKFTYFGDANLDGQVDITDLGNLATAWQTTGTWINGDFDYSGFIDITDLGKLATNWQAGVGNPLGPSLGEALASLGLPAVSVPEPAGTGATVVAIAMARRGRRRSAMAGIFPQT